MDRANVNIDFAIYSYTLTIIYTVNCLHKNNVIFQYGTDPATCSDLPSCMYIALIVHVDMVNYFELASDMIKR